MFKFSRVLPYFTLIITVLVLMTFHRWSNLNQKAKTYITQYYEVKADNGPMTPDTISPSDFDSVKTMVLFIGYPRSSHTLVASLLDAHPNSLISNEYNVIKKWESWPTWQKEKFFLFQELYKNSYNEVLSGYRAAENPRGFFGYHVPNQWQGKFDQQLKVIGDKNGGSTTQLLTRFKKYPVLEDMMKNIDIPVKFIHIVRNPFDNIATMVLRKLQLRKDITSAKDKVDDVKVLRSAYSWYFRLVEMNSQLHELIGYENVLDIHSEEVTQKPKEILAEICVFLGLTCSQNYLESCAKVVHKSTTHTRDYIKWPKELIEDIEKKIRSYKFLNGYTFTS